MNFLDTLNQNQYKAATSQSQYLRIVAGAGTGKTKTLTCRIAYLISQGRKPERRVARTFTNKAAKEMENRANALLQKEGLFSRAPRISTFHSFFIRFLRKEVTCLNGFTESFQIADDNDQASILKQKFSTRYKGKSKDFTKEVTNKIESLQTDNILPDEITPSDIPTDAIYTINELREVYYFYQEAKRRQNLRDFNDILRFTYQIRKNNEAVRLNWQRKFDRFLVDEFQDTNTLQYDIVKAFLSPTTSLTVVGDPDQTIYTWRGAKNAIIRSSLQKDFPNLETVVLDQNYRSTQNILDAANSLINHNSDRRKKDLVAASKQKGNEVSYHCYANDIQESDAICQERIRLHRKENVPFKDRAVLYRSNYLSRSIEKQLTRYKIPYVIYGGRKFYERAEIKDALSYLRLAVNPDDISFERVRKAPTKGIGDVTMTMAHQLQKETGDSLFDIFKDHQDELKLRANTKIALKKFYDAFNEFNQVYLSEPDPNDLLNAIHVYFEHTGFLDYVHNQDVLDAEKKSRTAQTSSRKRDNVNEFFRAISNYFDSELLDDEGKPVSPTLIDYLRDVALQSDQDTRNEDNDKARLRTGHVSKGLEFPYVFILGLEDGVFPTSHARKSGLRSSIEEERRLLYVCRTRAQKRLYLSCNTGRNRITQQNNRLSRFLKEIDIPAIKGNKQTEKINYSAYIGANRPHFDETKQIQERLKQKMQSTAQSSSSADNNYSIGDRVVHTSFGVGKVVEVEGKSIKVQFKDPYGIKKLRIGFKAFRKRKEGE